MNFLKIAACFLSSFSMVLSPMAQAKGKENERREQVEQFLKNTGLGTKKLTASEYWYSVRHVFPQNMRFSLDRWVSLNREQMMPTIQVTNFKDANGTEQVRLFFTAEGQSVTVTYTGNEDFPLKINGVSFSKKEVNEHDLNKIAARLIKEDSSVRKVYAKGDLPSLRKNKLVLSLKEFRHLTAKQRAEYLYRLRLTMEAATKVFGKKRGQQALEELNRNHPWVRSFFFGEDAFAGDAGKSCIIAGYISKIGENGSCGGVDSGLADLRKQTDVLRTQGADCGGDSTPCNPMVYGYSGSQAFCVPRAAIKYATAECNKMSPVGSDADKKRIIESYLRVQEKRKINLDIKNETVSDAQLKEVSGYLGGLNGYISDARSHCNSREESREEQDSACNELLTRAFDLQAFGGGAITPPAGELPNGVGQLPSGDCESQKPGSVLSGDGSSCLCPDGTDEGNMNGQPACVAISSESSKVVKDKSTCGFWCRNKGWIIGGAIGLAAFAGIWWLTSGKTKKGKPQPYTPPAGPAQDICISPMVLVGGVCQIPVVVNPPIVEPPPVITEGGTTPPSTGSGGIR